MFKIWDSVEGGYEGGIEKYKNDKRPTDKDDVVRELIPEHVSECALWTGKGHDEPCVSAAMIGDIKKHINAGAGSHKDVMDSAKAKTNCTSEKCVLEALKPHLGEARVKAEIANSLKITGPTDTKLLSNINIDAIMRQYMNKFPSFFPYNFNMLNYASYRFENGYVIDTPDTLSSVLFADLMTGEFDGHKYDCAGCIINTDTYQGAGKHWMALFADTRTDPCTVEFFNSSGNSPAPEWISWMVKTRDGIIHMMEHRGTKVNAEVKKVTNIRHQQSKTECGLYSLFYVWARLHDVPIEYFMNTPIPDQLMFEFRQHLFSDSRRVKIKKFDWNSYKNSVNIEWE
jgi:hypothetical protein